jgi:hypothetical protein
MANPANSSENPALQAWVDKWSAKYPPTWDKNVQPLAGRPSFGHKEVEAVYQWKFRRLWPQRKIDAMRTLSQNEVIWVWLPWRDHILTCLPWSGS